MNQPVKGRRPYNSSRRKQQALETRAAVVETAKRLFLEAGYVSTTIAAVAAESGVSVETIYKSFGGKSELVHAIYEQALAGAGSVHAEIRSDQVVASEPDPRRIIREWGELMTEVAPRVSPILLLVRDAAATDREMAGLAARIADERLQRMAHNARGLADGGHLREGISVEHAADVFWTYSSPDLYSLLIVDRGWSLARYAAFAADAMIAAVLPPET